MCHITYASGSERKKAEIPLDKCHPYFQFKFWRGYKRLYRLSEVNGAELQLDILSYNTPEGIAGTSDEFQKTLPVWTQQHQQTWQSYFEISSTISKAFKAATRKAGKMKSSPPSVDLPIIFVAPSESLRGTDLIRV